MARPMSVSSSPSNACNSRNKRTASATARGTGGSKNGNVSTSPKRQARMASTTAAKLVRWISGCV